MRPAWRQEEMRFSGFGTKNNPVCQCKPDCLITGPEKREAFVGKFTGWFSCQSYIIMVAGERLAALKRFAGEFIGQREMPCVLG